MKCPICEHGKLIASSRMEPLRYKNRLLQVEGYLISNCNRCNASLVMPAQMKVNQQLMADAERRADGLLVGGEIKFVRELMKLNRRQASKVFGGGPNAFSKYERGEIHPSEAVNKLMILARDVPEARKKLLQAAGMAGTNQWIDDKPEWPTKQIGSTDWLNTLTSRQRVYAQSGSSYEVQ